jgi:hypothetical protein
MEPQKRVRIVHNTLPRMESCSSFSTGFSHPRPRPRRHLTLALTAHIVRVECIGILTTINRTAAMSGHPATFSMRTDSVGVRVLLLPSSFSFPFRLFARIIPRLPNSNSRSGDNKDSSEKILKQLNSRLRLRRLLRPRQAPTRAKPPACPSCPSSVD